MSTRVRKRSTTASSLSGFQSSVQNRSDTRGKKRKTSILRKLGVNYLVIHDYSWEGPDYYPLVFDDDEIEKLDEYYMMLRSLLYSKKSAERMKEEKGVDEEFRYVSSVYEDGWCMSVKLYESQYSWLILVYEYLWHIDVEKKPAKASTIYILLNKKVFREEEVRKLGKLLTELIEVRKILDEIGIEPLIIDEQTIRVILKYIDRIVFGNKLPEPSIVWYVDLEG